MNFIVFGFGLRVNLLDLVLVFVCDGRCYVLIWLGYNLGVLLVS